MATMMLVVLAILMVWTSLALLLGAWGGMAIDRASKIERSTSPVPMQVDVSR